MQWSTASEKDWNQCFAWFPKQMDNGVYVWLEFYEWKLFRDRSWLVLCVRSRLVGRCWEPRASRTTALTEGKKKTNVKRFKESTRPSKPPPTPPPLRYIKEVIGYGEMPVHAPLNNVGRQEPKSKKGEEDE